MFDDKNKQYAPKQGYHAKTQRFASKIHYTVSVIPNNDLVSWRAERARIEAVNEDKALEARCRAIDAVAGQSKSLIHDRESAYIDQVASLASYKATQFNFVREPRAAPKTLVEKILGWFK